MENFKLNLLGAEYEVIFLKEIEPEDGTFIFGDCNEIDKQIRIATESNTGRIFSEKELIITLLHEITHAILMEGQYKSTNEDEPLVEWIAKNLQVVIPQIYRNDTENNTWCCKPLK